MRKQAWAEVWLIDPQAKTVEVLRLQGKKYFVEATLAGDQVLTSNFFPGWQLPLAVTSSTSSDLLTAPRLRITTPWVA